MTGITEVDVIIIIAAVLTAVGVIWRKAIRPVVKAAALFMATAPTLVEIAQEFKDDGNGSLRSVVNRIESKADKAAALAAEAKTAAEEAAAVSDRNRIVLVGRLDAIDLSLVSAVEQREATDVENSGRIGRIEEAVGAVPSGDGEAANRIERIEQAVGAGLDAEAEQT